MNQAQFLQCHANVKFPVLRARHAIHVLKRNFLKRNHQTLAPASRRSFPVESALNGQHFTANDRRAVVESLLHREDVVAQLLELVFPVALTARRADRSRASTAH